MPSRREELELVRIVAAAIEKHARGDVEKLALSVQRRARNTRSGDRRHIFTASTGERDKSPNATRAVPVSISTNAIDRTRYRCDCGSLRLASAKLLAINIGDTEITVGELITRVLSRFECVV